MCAICSLFCVELYMCSVLRNTAPICVGRVLHESGERDVSSAHMAARCSAALHRNRTSTCHMEKQLKFSMVSLHNGITKQHSSAVSPPVPLRTPVCCAAAAPSPRPGTTPRAPAHRGATVAGGSADAGSCGGVA